ncbi:hypothetical protein ACFOZ0_18375 [Streptomyces yaanensis]|uniref:Ricin B lectin domain-containing protein n=1 Tax=Streptomyces yaanensis TaxID=1142239 RepID=A0ABV7SGA0_9ACTN
MAPGHPSSAPTRQGAQAGCTKAITWTCNGQDDQQWNLNTDGSVTDAQSGLWLDVTGAAAAVELWT